MAVLENSLNSVLEVEKVTINKKHAIISVEIAENNKNRFLVGLIDREITENHDKLICKIVEQLV